MIPFSAKTLPEKPDAKAPDGSAVRVLLSLSGGGMATFELPPGATSMPVKHRTVEEIWFVLRGTGEMWRKQAELEEVLSLGPDVCLTIPLGTAFQFRCTGPDPLTILGVTMPPWPGEGEAYQVEGKWPEAHTDL
jgi:mannose-6-phosphate isomerase-like protein (cupin superfamily)